jgi:hypothetical protein
MTQVCIEYHKKFELYDGIIWQKDYLNCYNYRCLNNIFFREIWECGSVISKSCEVMCQVSPNY